MEKKLKDPEQDKTLLAAKLFVQAMELFIMNPAGVDDNGEELTGVQYLCLRFIKNHPNPSGMELAEGLRISNAAATKLIDRLAKKGLLTRSEHPEDRRQMVIRLTKTGEGILKQVRQMEEKRFADILAGMKQDEAEAFHKGITGFLAIGLSKKELVDAICLHCGQEHIPDCPGNEVYYKLTGRNREKV